MDGSLAVLPVETKEGVSTRITPIGLGPEPVLLNMNKVLTDISIDVRPDLRLLFFFCKSVITIELAKSIACVYILFWIHEAVDALYYF